MQNTSRDKAEIKQKLILTEVARKFHSFKESQMLSLCSQSLVFNQLKCVARPQSKFPTRPTASKPYIARSDCAYVIEQSCGIAHALTVLPAFSQ
jgi:hypothetical protein